MKKGLALLLSGILVLSTPVYASDTDSRIQEIESQIADLRKELNELKASQIGEEALNVINSKGLSLLYEKHEVTTDYEGKKCVLIYFTFANDSDENATFAWSWNIQGFQNGVQLDSAYLSDSEDNNYREIQPGASLEVTQAYELPDEAADVQIDVDDIISFSSDVLGSQILKLQ